MVTQKKKRRSKIKQKPTGQSTVGPFSEVSKHMDFIKLPKLKYFFIL
jgi:hypothetical protein